MERKYKVKADGVQGLKNGFVLQWCGEIGFGEYTIYIDENGKWKGESECMDRGDDKSFLEHLFRNIIEQIEVR